ncbi:MAG: dihydrolipoyl dehydrogenase [Bacteroidaceae bacterium]|nr:dihydrolipoyl dehydrogenase [Bacteroidaceae bacterium]
MQDLIIIGSGPGGYHTAVYAAQHGLSVTIVERAQAGGTCLNCGCIPTKAICRSAEVADTLREAEDYGLRPVEVAPDFARIMQRKDAIVEQLRSGVEQLMTLPGITYIKGVARVRGPHEVDVDGTRLEARNIILATGSLPKRLPLPGAELEGVLDSTAALALTEKPASLVIIGAGVIGMEMASAFASLGVNVSVVEFLKECLPMLDADIAKRLRQSMSKRGVEFYMQSACKEIVREGGLLRVVFERKGKEESVVAEKVLIATGRAPQTDGLGLDEAGIATERGAVVTDNNLRTSVPSIYAVGDVNARCMLAHAATMQGKAVVDHLLSGADTTDIVGLPCLKVMPSAIFTRPEAACVGLDEDAARELLGEKPVVKKSMYRANGKAVAMGETEGLLKLICDAAGTVLGCHVYGAHAADLVQEVSALMHTGVTVNGLADITHIHPTLSEILWEAVH